MSHTPHAAQAFKLAYTIFYVENVPDTLVFYERAFGFARKFLH